MSFASPAALLLLLLVPVVAVAYRLADGRRRRRSSAFASPSLQPNLVAERPGRRRHVPVVLALLALTLLVVGVARPHLDRSVTVDEATIVLAIDTSRSMSAADVAPTRLAAAKRAIVGLLDTAPEGYRVGIVSFSNAADAVLVPTRDRDAARAALRELRPGSGTAIGEAIVRSLQLTDAGDDAPARSDSGVTRPPAAVLLLSDGAQTAEGVTPLAAAETARELGIPVSTVALGTRDAVVEVPLGNGLTERVTVPPDAATLRQVAAATGGTFNEVLDPERLRAVYEDLGTRLAREQQRVEVTSAFAVGGALALLLGGALSTAWFRRAL
ncbi:MAG: VWA domain-containing protein [Gaiella sp.]